MIVEIRDAARARNVTRLCHFTPSRNLVHIFGGKVGILATRTLTESERAAFTPTDLERLDGFTQHVCCSVEYPNAWYFDRARGRDILFKDWVVLLIRPDSLWTPGTLFCARNAAASNGSMVAAGFSAFEAMYSRVVQGARGISFRRAGDHLPCSPTDDQAEVLVPDTIGLADIIGIAVRDVTQAKAEAARLRLLAVDPTSVRFVVAPEFYDKRELSSLIRNGRRPAETEWKVGS